MISIGVSSRRHATLLAIASMALIASPSTAQVILDTQFLATEGETGYVDGSLPFQQPFGPVNGIDGGPRNGQWLGQQPEASAGPFVDSTNGIVNTNSGSFRRNAWSEGVNGGFLGQGGAGETGNGGFTLGDRAAIEIDYQITLGTTTTNQTFFNVGVKDTFASDLSFEARPDAGFEVGYSNFEGGLFRVFTDIGRAVFAPVDAPFALTFDPADAGLNNGFDGGPVDSVSDNLSFRYEIELVDEATGLWQPTELTVTNLDTTAVIAQALVEEGVEIPQSLESFLWNPTTGVNSGDASDFFLGIEWLSGGDSAGTGAASSQTSRLLFEFFPNVANVAGDFNGDGAVDAADYTVWRDNLGATEDGSVLNGNGNGGTVDETDYALWVANFGGPTPPASTAVPEPSALILLAFSAVSACVCRCRSWF